ncbi:Putative ABC transporter ATP-binding protein AlbC [Corynebacterium heidelbergense]|nr:Putative ABC transporter ATP-binding protein AlbC [Corynebacterium heidelbergense]
MDFAGNPTTPDSPGFKRTRMTVFTEDQSFRNWSFETYLRFVSAAYDKAPDDILHELIDGFNFGSFAKTRIGELSSRNSKKARLIAAFAIKPPLLILDEPVDALDSLGTDFLYSSIR